MLGIDPGLKATGYGLIDIYGNDCRLIETGTIITSADDSLQNRIGKIYRLLAEFISEFQPQILVLEKLYAHTLHPMTASVLGHVRGVICLLCSQKNIGLVEYSPKRIRQAITGNGNAAKTQVKRLVGHMLGIDEAKLTLDAGDALALALGYKFMTSFPSPAKRGEGQGRGADVGRSAMQSKEQV
ncbi:MAG: crossover junction endodeoxyribonuclease RuvC [Candidatus Omnitrophica bacterium]|nr:crossover junction endodeoxyribonuclease RuvC [Candidatus Omnitrophota bacterium]